jgi:hypothetical protein
MLSDHEMHLDISDHLQPVYGDCVYGIYSLVPKFILDYIGNGLYHRPFGRGALLKSYCLATQLLVSAPS